MRYSECKSFIANSRIRVFPALLLAISFLLASCNSPAPLNGDKKILADVLTAAERSNADGDYAAAASKLVRALVLSEEASPSSTPGIRKRLCETYLEWARSLYWRSKSENAPEMLVKAIELCEKAAATRPRSKRKCDIYAARFESDLKALNYRKAVSLETLDPGFKERRYKIDLLFKQAKVLRKAGDYMRAKEKLEELLILDPYNIDATREFKKIMKQVAEAGEERAMADKRERAAEAVWKNVRPIEKTETPPPRIDQKPPLDLCAKLESFRLDQINFKDAPLDQAFAAIEKEVRSNILKSFKLKYENFSPADSKWPPITFEAKKVPAYDALKAICDGVGLSLSLSEDSLVISPRK